MYFGVELLLWNFGDILLVWITNCTSSSKLGAASKPDNLFLITGVPFKQVQQFLVSGTPLFKEEIHDSQSLDIDKIAPLKKGTFI